MRCEHCGAEMVKSVYPPPELAREGVLYTFYYIWVCGSCGCTKECVDDEDESELGWGGM